MASLKMQLFGAMLTCILVVQVANGRGQGLQYGFYRRSCPTLDYIVSNQVNISLNNDNTLGASLLRLQFHDCFVRGCDASILLNSLVGPPAVPAEKDSAPNAGSLRGYDVIDAIKTAVEAKCPNTVSCADLITLASAYAVLFSKGPFITYELGRRDGVVSLSADALNNLPAPFHNLTTLISKFSAKGLNTVDLVALSGSHTIGRAHCAAILTRLYNFDGQGNPDPSLDAAYRQTLRGLCPTTNPGNLIPMDPSSQLVFDPNYYTNVLRNRGLFTSDASLLTSAYTKSLTTLYTSRGLFNAQFYTSMVKMSKVGVLTGSSGQIRKVCSVIN